MPDITSLIMQQLTNPKVLDTASKQLGLESNKLTSVVSGMLPMILAGLTRNANKTGGADALFDVLKRDHDGSVLDNILSLLTNQLTSGSSKSGGGFLQMLMSLFFGGKQTSIPKSITPKTLDGDKILEHVLGDKRKMLEKGISQVNDLDLDQVSDLASKFAPLVMGSLGKLQHQQNLDASGLANLLQQEIQGLEQKVTPKSASGLLEMLDLDGDGDMTDDLMNFSKVLLGKS